MLKYLKKKLGINEDIHEEVEHKRTSYHKKSDVKTNNKDLIVDDSTPNRTVMRNYLSRYGRQSDEACNGQDAIEKIKLNGTYNIVWMDLQMPIMNGIQCTQKLRLDSYPGCIIGLTGHVDEESKNNCISAGMQNILAKPIDKQILQTYIDEYSF